MWWSRRDMIQNNTVNISPVNQHQSSTCNILILIFFTATKTTRPVAPDEYLISPITGERIPASKVQEHMRIGLLDPRWVEQRDKHLDKLAQETVFAPGTAIEASLKQLAERRTDIFGVGDEETAIGKKIGEEDKKKDDKVTWDGHTSSVEAATRAARANITLEEQIHQIHKVKGLLPDEEKEKIGPKPVNRATELSHMAAAASKPQATLKAPPKPPAPKPISVPAQPPPPPTMSMPTMGIPQPMMPQAPMMMMAPMPPMAPRPPPLMSMKLFYIHSAKHWTSQRINAENSTGLFIVFQMIYFFH